MSLATQLLSNVKLLIQNKALPESILIYVQFKTNSYLGRCFAKTDSPVDSKEFIELMAHLDEELLKLEDVWKESYGNTNEIHKLVTSFKKWNEFVAKNLAIICGLMLDPDAYITYALLHMATVHEAESERILSIETKQPQLHDEAKLKLRGECSPMVIVYPCLKVQDQTKYPERLEILSQLNEDLKIALDQAEGHVNPNIVHQFIKIIVGMNDDSSSEETSSDESDEDSKETDTNTIDDKSNDNSTIKTEGKTIREKDKEFKEKHEALKVAVSKDLAKICAGDITIEELEALQKRSEEKFLQMKPTSNEDDRILDQLISRKKYYGDKAKETSVSTGSMMDIILAMMGSFLKDEKPDAKPEDKNTHQIMRNLLGIYKIMRDSFVPEDEE